MAHLFFMPVLEESILAQELLAGFSPVSFIQSETGFGGVHLSP
jgi:hypothetical protein